MKAIDAIRKQPVTASPETTLYDAAALMDAHAVGALAIVDGGALVGIVTDRDLVVRGLARREPGDVRVDSTMTRDPVVLDSNADLRDAMAIFRTHAIRRLPLVEDGKFVGMLVVDDLLIDVIANLGDLVRPITGEVIFGYPEASRSTSAAVRTS